MQTLRVNPANENQEKPLKAVSEALQVGYEEDVTESDETERILGNAYLTEKLEQSRKDMQEGKGKKIALKYLWK